jgi:phosphatidylglycerol:prolipoprotein diacylglycerol transferase
MALAFWFALMAAKRLARREGLNPEVIHDLFFYVLISAIVGSRLFYVATNFETYVRQPLDIFKIWEGGLVFYGGFIAAAIVVVVFLKKNKIPLWKTADVAAPAVAFGHFWGRIGCFFAGCCYGKTCHLPWAVTFTAPESLAPLNTPLHPTQLYSALNNLAIFGILLFFGRRKKFPGQVFFLYVFLYGITRSIIEYFRDDFRGAVFDGMLSTSQAIGLSLAAFSAAMLIIGWKKAKTDETRKNAGNTAKRSKQNA